MITGTIFAVTSIKGKILGSSVQKNWNDGIVEYWIREEEKKEMSRRAQEYRLSIFKPKFSDCRGCRRYKEDAISL